MSVDPDVALDAAREIAAMPGPMEIVAQPVSVLQLVGLIQLACRHPRLPPESRAAAARFVSGAREYFADCPSVLSIIDAGDDPSQDVSWDRGAGGVPVSKEE
jgi:hypothetical protein